MFGPSIYSSVIHPSSSLLPPDVVAVEVGGHPCLVLCEESLLLVERSDGGCSLYGQT